MKPSFQIPTFLVFRIIAFTALSNLATGLTPMSDNFNDNLLDLTKWDDSFAFGGSISESGGKIDYIVSDPELLEFDFAGLSYPSQSNPTNPGSTLGSNENWQVIVDVNNTSMPVSSGEISSAGIQIVDANYDGDFIFLELYSSSLDELPLKRAFISNLGTNGVDVPASDIDTGNLPGQTIGSLKIAYNGASKIVTTYYDATGSSNGFQWVQLASYGLNGSGGANGNTDWGLTTSGFIVSIYGYSELMVLTPGEVSLDNFSLTESAVNQEITVEQAAGTALCDAASSVGFESTSPGTPVTKTFTIRNDGQQPLTGLALSKIGPNAVNFTLGSLGVASLAAGASTTFNVTCSPQAGTPQTASLRIASNDADETSFEIALFASVSTVNGDNFNDNIKDSAKWDTDITFGTGGALTETSSRLQYTSTSATGEHGVYWPWIFNQATYDKDWELIMDVGNSLSWASGFRDTGIGIEIFPTSTTEMSFFTEMNSSRIGSSFHGFISGRGEDETGMSDQEVSSAGVNGSIRIVFNSAFKVFTTYFDTDGSSNGYSWTPLGTLRINGFSGYAADWTMSGSDTFQIAVYGFVDGSTVTSGQMTADNFSIITQASGTPATPLQIWQVAKLGSASSIEASLNFDADKDGLLNLLEYAFKLEPGVPGTPVLTTLTGTSGLPVITPVGSGPTQRLRLEYVRMKATFESGINYVPQFSSNLQGGGTGGWVAAAGPETVESIDTQWERVVIEDTAGTGLSNRFGRVRVTAP